MKSRSSILFTLYILGFLFAIHSAIPYFINSTYLGQIVKDSFSPAQIEQIVSIIYIVASFITVLCFIKMPALLTRYGNFRLSLVLSIGNLLSLIGMAFLSNMYFALVAFIVFDVTTLIIAYCLDIFIEHNSVVEETGVIRTIYLTAVNLAWLFGPLIAGFILGFESFRNVFLISGAIMLPVILIILKSAKNVTNPNYENFNFWLTFKEVRQNTNVRQILMTNFILQFFYVWMVIYIPVYLNINIGFDWITIGKILTIMLVPFVLIQYPVGILADKRYGEKEMLTIGFIIIAVTTTIIPLFADSSFWLWAGLLFTTRIGAAMVEAMNDVYFFKNIGEKDANIISFYRMMSPIAYIVAPIIGILFLNFFPLGYLFYLLGFFMLFGIGYSLSLQDTL